MRCSPTPQPNILPKSEIKSILVIKGVMRFDTIIIAYDGDDRWVDAAVSKATQCLYGNTMPSNGDDCDNCRYFSERLIVQQNKGA